MQRWGVQSCAVRCPLRFWNCGVLPQLPARRESWAFLMYLLACPDPAFGKAEAGGSPICLGTLCAAPSPTGSPGGVQRWAFQCSSKGGKGWNLPGHTCSAAVAVPEQGRLCCFLNKEVSLIHEKLEPCGCWKSVLGD